MWQLTVIVFLLSNVKNNLQKSKVLTWVVAWCSRGTYPVGRPALCGKEWRRGRESSCWCGRWIPDTKWRIYSGIAGRIFEWARRIPSKWAGWRNRWCSCTLASCSICQKILLNAICISVYLFSTSWQALCEVCQVWQLPHSLYNYICICCNTRDASWKETKWIKQWSCKKPFEILLNKSMVQSVL